MNDIVLVNGLKNGDAEALGVLVSQYTNRLYNYAYYRCGDHHLAEDLVSDTITRIIEKIGSYEQREIPFSSWVFRIAHNLLANQFRYRHRHSTLSLDATNAAGERLIEPPGDAGAADGGELASQLADREELHIAILTLPEGQKTVFILRFIEGLDLKEVASLLEKSLPSIKSLQYRAVLNLRHYLQSPSSQPQPENENVKDAPRKKRVR